MYAIIQNGSHQYKVTPGMELSLYNLSKKEGEKVILENVLMVVNDDGNIQVGKPFVDKASVSLKVKKVKQGKKVNVMRFKAKSRYTKRQGFRENLTVVYVDTIKVDSKTYKASSKSSLPDSKLNKKVEVKEATTKVSKKDTVDSNK